MGFWLALACRDGLVRHACGSYPLMQGERTQSQIAGAYDKAWGETRPSRAPGEALAPIVKRLRIFLAGRAGHFRGPEKGTFYPTISPLTDSTPLPRADPFTRTPESNRRRLFIGILSPHIIFIL